MFQWLKTFFDLSPSECFGLENTDSKDIGSLTNLFRCLEKISYLMTGQRPYLNTILQYDG